MSKSATWIRRAVGRSVTKRAVRALAMGTCLFMVLGSAACGQAMDGVTTTVRAPNPRVAGARVPGTFGVERFVGKLDGVAMELSMPITASGPRAGRIIVLVQGGAVDVTRYRWLADDLASHGYVVIAASHLANLAIFDVEASLRALRAVRAAAEGGALAGRIAPGAPVWLGHSLGGVVATKAWLNAAAPEVAALGLLASIPDPADTLPDAQVPVLSVVGDADGSIAPDEVAEGAARFDDVRVVRIAGMNHYDWTTGASAEDLAKDGPSAGTVPAQRAATRLLLAFVRSVYRAGGLDWGVVAAQPGPYVWSDPR